MLVSKILEGTLSAGQTSISFTDSDIPNSFIRIGSTDADLMPVSQSLSGNVLTITYEAQSSSKGILVNLIKSGLTVIDALDSTDSENALSAKQGKVLKDTIDGLSFPSVIDNLNSDSTTDALSAYQGKVLNSLIKNNISDMSDVSITDIENGQVLAWDSVSEKFINVNQSGGGSADLSELYPDDNNEHQIGTNLFIKHYTGSSVSGDTLIDSAWTDKQLINVYGYVLSTLSGYTNQVYTLNSYINGDWFAFGFQKRNEGQLRLSVGNNLHGAYEMWVVYRKIGG